MNSTFVFLLLVAAVATALHAGGGKKKSPPPLPYLSFSTWAVLTNNQILTNGSQTLLWSYGEHVQVDWAAKVRCRYEVQELQPIEKQITWTSVANFTAGWMKNKIQTQNGTSINCTKQDISTKKLQRGGDWYLAPSPVLMAQMTFLEYVVLNSNVNSSLYQLNGMTPDGVATLLQWFVSVDGGVPQLYVNKSYNPITKTGTILTTTFEGYHQLGALNEACWYPGCGSEKCVANINAGNDAIIDAIGWACGQPLINCGNVSTGGTNYYPNTAVAHGTFVFNEYFTVNEVYGQGACDFNGAALLVTCETSCQMCNATATATDAEIGAALAWVCSKDGIQDCSPIQPGGWNYWPNTTRAHANWAFNVYFQAYSCTPGISACNFNHTAAVVKC